MNANEDYKKRPDEIESELEQTRAQVSSTIEAIQQKLTPGQLMDQAIDYWRRSAPADFGSNLSRNVRENPLPVTLIGVGIAWLMMGGRQDKSRSYATDYGYEDDYSTATAGYGDDSDYDDESSGLGDAAQRVKDTTAQWSESAGETLHDYKERAAGLGDQVKQRASALGSRARGSVDSLRGRAAEMRGRAGGMAYSARERLSETAESARARMSDMRERSRDRYYQAREGVSHMVDEQPLVLGAIGLAIGAVLGASLPATRREDELLGSKRDDLMAGAKERARAQMETVKESAQRVAQTAQAEVQRTTEDLQEGMRNASGDQAAFGSQSAENRPSGI